jgi:hypothetical protein
MELSDTTYILTRLLFQRALAAVYLIGFLVVIHQFNPLLGEKGLLPVGQFTRDVPFWRSPSLFYLFPKDFAFTFFGWLGAALSVLALSGYSEKFGTPLSMAVWGLLWILYLSYINVGQTFYAFGWESLLVETGFYAIFLGAASTKPSFLVILMIRWLLFRVMFGAGLIKIRGDDCWRDLSCLKYHYETQPIPNPFSWYFHQIPGWFQSMSVFTNHVVELIVPFFFFLPQPFAAIAGLITLFFHFWLMVSGNFAFLGLLTMVLSISTLPDSFLGFLLPFSENAAPMVSVFYLYMVYLVTALVAALSYAPIKNMLSPRQVMNTSYNPLHLVGTYGAFGSITRTRYEVILEGTDAQVLTPQTVWKEYEFYGKPGDVNRRPVQIAPYHLRLDWLMWFQPFRAQVIDNKIKIYGYDPWFLHFMAKLLENDRPVLSLMRENPFPNQPPHFLRALFYQYRFTTPEERKATGAWWHRDLVGSYFPVVSLDNPSFQEALQSQGWRE